MKYLVRRAVVSIVLSPAVAFAYVLGYAFLVGLGAKAGVTVRGAWDNGVLVAIAVALVFTFFAGKGKLA
jgi:hypothetical protein